MANTRVKCARRKVMGATAPLEAIRGAHIEYRLTTQLNEIGPEREPDNVDSNPSQGLKSIGAGKGSAYIICSRRFTHIQECHSSISYRSSVCALEKRYSLLLMARCAATRKMGIDC